MLLLSRHWRRVRGWNPPLEVLTWMSPSKPIVEKEVPRIKLVCTVDPLKEKAHLMVLHNEMFREEFWWKWGCPRELYPDASSKDAPVPPGLLVPNCECGFPADVFQSRYPDTAARCFYTCSRFNISNCFHYLFFFICVSRLLIFCWNLVV